jgi:hypothetical protein
LHIGLSISDQGDRSRSSVMQDCHAVDLRFALTSLLLQKSNSIPD